MKFKLIIAVMMLWAIDLQAQENKTLPASGGKLNLVQANMDIRHYTLSLNVDIVKKFIKGYTEIDLNLSHKSDTLLFDLIQLYKVNKIWVNGKEQKFSHKGDSILITNSQSYKQGENLVKIDYEGNPPVATRPPWDGGFTWEKDKAGNPWVSLNCQLNGAKIFFPCKDHPSDEPNEGVDLLITVPQNLLVTGPGLLQDVKRNKDQVTWHWRTNYTISNYCIVFNIGKYKLVEDSYTTIDNNKVLIQFYVLQEDAAYVSHAIELKKRDSKVLEKYFGEYPWTNEKIGLAEVPNPGMEHQTMVTYGDHFKYKRIGGQDYSDNLFHEYAHEWWANKITNKDWSQMWIQEGIATYAEALCMRELSGEKGYDSMMLRFRTSIQNKKPVVVNDVANTKDAYNGDIYVKGAFFMHTLRYVLGDSVFFPILKKFITDVKYPYNNFFVTDDVEHFFSTQTKGNLKPLFDFYLRTTQIIYIDVRKISLDTYSMEINDAPMLNLPLDILTDKGIVHITMEDAVKKRFKIISKTQPVIDPRGWYFKKVILQ